MMKRTRGPRIDAAKVEQIRRMVVDQAIPQEEAAAMAGVAYGTVTSMVSRFKWPVPKAKPAPHRVGPSGFGLKPDAAPFFDKQAEMTAADRWRAGDDRYVRALIRDSMARGLLEVRP